MPTTEVNQVTHNPITERKQREADARRKHITSVVKSLIKKGGAAAVTIRKVAELAGFSTTVVYSLYHDKATLITQTMDEDLLELVKTMRRACGKLSDPEERIRAAGRAYVEYGLKHPDEYALVFMERRPHAPNAAAVVQHGNVDQDPYAFAHHLFVDLVNSRRRSLDEQTVHLMTQIFWQGLHGMTSLALVMGADDEWTPTIDRDTHLNALLDVLLAGLRQRFEFS